MYVMVSTIAVLQINCIIGHTGSLYLYDHRIVIEKGYWVVLAKCYLKGMKCLFSLSVL